MKRQWHNSHFAARLRQRYGLRLSEQEIEALCGRIARGEGIPLCIQNSATLVVEIPLHGRRVVVAIDIKTMQPKTALPPRRHRTVEQYLQKLRKFFYWE